MADSNRGNVFYRLRKLFSSGTVVRHAGGKELDVVDMDFSQSYPSNALRDRYSRIFSTVGLGAAGGNQYGLNNAYQAQRIMLFRNYEAMDQTPMIHAALDIAMEHATLKNQYGDVLRIECDNSQVKDILHNLYYDILNIQFNIRPWTRSMLKYGDMFLFMEISQKFGIIGTTPLSVYDTIRVEAEDPTNPKYVYFQTLGMHGAKMKMENYEVVHFRLMTDMNTAPYGLSYLEGARRAWTSLEMMQDAVLLHRIMRAPERRVIKVDIGNIAPNEVDAYMEALATKMKKVPYIDPQTGEYNLRYNVMNILDDVYIPIRGSDSGTSVDVLPGLAYDGIADLEYLRNMVLTALRIPRSFLWFDDSGGGDKHASAAADVRFSRQIEWYQEIIIEQLKKIAVIHLYALGYTDDELVDFELHLTPPSTIYEQEKLNLLKEQTDVAMQMQQLKMLSNEWIYKTVFNLSDEEIVAERERVVHDTKNAFRLAAIEGGQSDPAVYGFPQDQEPQVLPPGENSTDDNGTPTEEAIQGRPKTGMRYGQDSHPRGRDPIGYDDHRNATRSPNIKLRKDKPKSPLSLEMKTRLDIKLGRVILVEDDKLPEDKGTFLDESLVEHYLDPEKHDEPIE